MSNATVVAVKTTPSTTAQYMSQHPVSWTKISALANVPGVGTYKTSFACEPSSTGVVRR